MLFFSHLGIAVKQKMSKSQKKVHSLFLEYFLLTASSFAASDTFDFCDPFKQAAAEEEEKKSSVSIDEWVEVWGDTVGRARKMDDLPMWLQYYPKTLFDTINRR